MQRSIQQDAGVIAGEWSAGAVGAVHAGRQPDDQQARAPIAERGHRGARGSPDACVGRVSDDAPAVGTGGSRDRRQSRGCGRGPADRIVDQLTRTIFVP